MSAWVEGRVAGRRHGATACFRCRSTRRRSTFVAGQFARLALPAPPGSKEPMLGRPYSFVNPPAAQPHEFYFIVLPDGPLSPRLAALERRRQRVARAARQRLLHASPRPREAESLWCLSTGTGIGPFLSMLRTDEPWAKFGRVVLVHAVRHARGAHLPRRHRRHRAARGRARSLRADGQPRGAPPTRSRDASRTRSTTAGSRRASACRSPPRTRTRCCAAIRRWSTTCRRCSRRAACGGTGARSRGTSRSRPTGRRARASVRQVCA